MKTIVIYYSYTGNTKKLAQKRAAEENADIAEVRDRVRPSTFKAYTSMCVAAMRQKKTDIVPLALELKPYDRIIIMAPVWANYAAPAVNHVFDMLPTGKEVELVMVSRTGKSNKDKIQSQVWGHGCKVVGYQDVKA